MKKSKRTELVEFPLTVTFENGSKKEFEDESDLEMDLDDFDSSTATGCRVTDAQGREVHLLTKWLCVFRLELKER